MSDQIATQVEAKAASWLKQPTTINGIGLLVGGFVTGVLHIFLLGDTTFSVVGGAFVTGVVHLVMKDNTAA